MTSRRAGSASVHRLRVGLRREGVLSPRDDERGYVGGPEHVERVGARRHRALRPGGRRRRGRSRREPAPGPGHLRAVATVVLGPAGSGARRRAGPASCPLVERVGDALPVGRAPRRVRRIALVSASSSRADPLAVAAQERHRRVATHRQAAEHDPVEPEPVEQRRDVVGDVVERGLVVAERRASEAAQVRRDDAEVGRRGRCAARATSRRTAGTRAAGRAAGPSPPRGRAGRRRHRTGTATRRAATATPGRAPATSVGQRVRRRRDPLDDLVEHPAYGGSPTHRCLPPSTPTTSACGMRANRSRASAGRR